MSDKCADLLLAGEPAVFPGGDAGCSGIRAMVARRSRP